MWFDALEMRVPELGTHLTGQQGGPARSHGRVQRQGSGFSVVGHLLLPHGLVACS